MVNLPNKGMNTEKKNTYLRRYQPCNCLLARLLKFASNQQFIQYIVGLHVSNSESNELAFTSLFIKNPKEQRGIVTDLSLNYIHDGRQVDLKPSSNTRITEKLAIKGTQSRNTLWKLKIKSSSQTCKALIDQWGVLSFINDQIKKSGLLL